ncbi:MAG: DUF3842 family protein [Oscillospiraceae bacterium]
MKILIIDGQGGGVGKNIIEQLLKRQGNIELVAVGTNSIASSAMLKAGATAVATGENPVIYNCKDADFIVGPIGIISANSMYGEISPNMALAVSQSKAKKVLIPISKSNIFVVSSLDKPMQTYIDDAVSYIFDIISHNSEN